MPNHATPTIIKIALDNPGGRPLNEREPKAIAGAPQMPSDLSTAEQFYWFQLCETLQGLGTLNTCDTAALRLFCEASVLKDRAKQEIDNFGLLIKSAQGMKKNPAVTIFNEQAHTVRTLLGEFGLTPASRSKITADSPELDSPLTKLLKSRPTNTFDGLHARAS